MEYMENPAKKGKKTTGNEGISLYENGEYKCCFMAIMNIYKVIHIERENCKDNNNDKLTRSALGLWWYVDGYMCTRCCMIVLYELYGFYQVEGYLLRIRRERGLGSA